MRILLALCLGLLTACVNPRSAVYKVAVEMGPLKLGSGSGFAVSPEYIVTAGHVCMAALFQNTLSINGRPLVFIRLDDRRDLCLLYSDVELPTYFRIATKPLSCASPGVVDYHCDPASVWGFPLGVSVPFPTRGEFAGTLEDDDDQQRVLLSVQAYGGNSGGPVLDAYGEVVGVLIAGSREYPQLSIATTLKDLRDFLGLED